MKKFTFALMMMLAYAGFTVAQTIEDFESIQLNGMEFGKTGKMTVVPNPDLVGNSSAYCVEFLRPGFTNGGKPWSGFWSALPVPVDVTVNKYVHVKVWKSEISDIKFKLEAGTSNDLEIYSMTEQTKKGAWEEIVFDFSSKTGTWAKIALMPDFIDPMDPVVNAADVTMYFDDIYVNNDPTPGSAAVTVIENFEPITMNFSGDGSTNKLTVVPNPDKSLINTSNYVIKYNRPGTVNGGQPWGGFWSDLPVAVDVTVNKFVHVKVWKSRISPLKFKLQGGTAGDLEIVSKYPQTRSGVWEDIVFDFSAKTGTYPRIVFMPDFEDPLVQAEDLTIYFDDIVVNNDPNPTIAVTFNVDMTGVLPAAGVKVYAAGSVFSNWAKPGDVPANEMTDLNADGIYTITVLNAPTGTYAFKFFKGAGWDGGEWIGDPNRTANITGSAVINCIWGQNGFVGRRENALAGKIQMYPNPVNNELTINSTEDVSRIIITNTVGKIVGNINYTNNQTINTSDLSRGLYFVTFINRDGTKTSQKLIKN